MIRSVVVVVAYLVGVASSVAAEPLSTRDILYLSKVIPGVRTISWCSDDTLTFGSVESIKPEQQDAPKREISVVAMLSLATRTSRPLVSYSNASVGAHCVRQGQFIYVSGNAHVGIWPDNPAHLTSGQRFEVSPNHLIAIGGTRTAAGEALPVVYPVRGPFFFGALRSASDGNIYGEVDAAGDFGRKNIARRETIPQAEDVPYTIDKGQFSFIVYSIGESRARPDFQIYGLYALSEERGFGSYECSAPVLMPRPDCGPRGARNNVVYYKYTKDGGPDKVIDVIYTISPSINSAVRRWPIVQTKASSLSYDFEILGVAIDVSRCFVLLQPKPWLASSRVAGRLNLDLFLADCAFKQGRLEYAEPHFVGRKQGSFVYAQVSLHGDTVVVRETIDAFRSQPDQFQFEGGAKKPVCTRLLQGNRASALKRINSICVLEGEWATRVEASPTAKFLFFKRVDEAIVLGRDFRQDGRGPEWLTNED